MIHNCIEHLNIKSKNPHYHHYRTVMFDCERALIGRKK